VFNRAEPALTATIDPGDGTSWRVGFALLRHVVDI
jgi:hypothetical protein